MDTARLEELLFGVSTSRDSAWNWLDPYMGLSRRIKKHMHNPTEKISYDLSGNTIGALWKDVLN